MIKDTMMTNAELRDHYIKKAEDASERAARRKAWIRRREARNLNAMYESNPKAHPTLHAAEKSGNSEQWAHAWNLAVDTKTNVAASTDGVWKGAVADNQWYTQYAQMYGIAALSDDIRALVGEIRGRQKA
jgi:hypothetical protein